MKILKILVLDFLTNKKECLLKREDCKRYNELCGGRNMKDLSVFPEVKGIRASPFMVDLMERNGVDTSNFYMGGEYN